MKLRMQPGICGALALLGSLLLAAALPSVVVAQAPQEGADAAAQAPSETPRETPAEEQAAAGSSDTVGEIIEGVLEDVDDVLGEVDLAEDARVYRGGEVSIMTSIHIPANEVHRGDVVCIGCDAVIDGEVHGDVVVVGGSLDLNGKAGHDVVCVLSEVHLGPDSSVDHDYINILSSLDDRGADFGNERIVVEPFFGLPSIGGAFGVLGGIILWGKLLKTVVVFLVILILAIFVPERIRVLSDEFPVSYGLALVVGFGGYVVLWLVNTLLAISVIGIPVAILLHLLFLVLKVLGLAGIFHFIGARLGRSLSREMSLLGAVFIGFLIFSVVLIVPHLFGFVGLAVAIVIRFAFWFLFECPAIGLILLTRAGGRPRNRPQAEPPAASAPPAPPVPSQAPAVPPSPGP
jgi:hypothetical protein